MGLTLSALSAGAELIGVHYLKKYYIGRVLFYIISALHCLKDTVELTEPAARQVGYGIAAVSCVIVVVLDTLTVVIEGRAVLSLRSYEINICVALLLQKVAEILSVAALVSHTVCDRIAQRHDLDGVGC